MSKADRIDKKAKRKRTECVADADADAEHLFETHVPLSKCQPKKLFRVAKDKAGLTSSWADIKFWQNLLSELVEKSNGQLVNQKRLANQLGAYLKKHGMSWSLTDVESAVIDLRAMLRTLHCMARDRTRHVPRNYECIMALVNKMNVDGIDDSGGNHDSEHNSGSDVEVVNSTDNKEVAEAPCIVSSQESSDLDHVEQALFSVTQLNYIYIHV